MKVEVQGVNILIVLKKEPWSTPPIFPLNFVSHTFVKQMTLYDTYVQTRGSRDASSQTQILGLYQFRSLYHDENVET